ncbi:MAG: type II toxin-antitoxin system VapC family toxin [Coriobacteriia bacterium]|nr:type II toxin-antitoxin system VapC family toxin [Coriobacteriia bacterium]
MSRPLRVSTGRPVVIDSSMAFKWFDGSESGADIALDLLRQHQRDEVALLAPAHMPLEVLNVFASRQMTHLDMERAVGFIADADLLIAPVDEALLIAAVRIAQAEQLALYDAVFIALAAALDAELVTADRKQAATSSCRVQLIG